MNTKQLELEATKYLRKSKAARKPHIKAAWLKMYNETMQELSGLTQRLADSETVCKVCGFPASSHVHTNPVVESR